MAHLYSTSFHPGQPAKQDPEQSVMSTTTTNSNLHESLGLGEEALAFVEDDGNHNHSHDLTSTTTGDNNTTDNHSSDHEDHDDNPACSTKRTAHTFTVPAANVVPQPPPSPPLPKQENGEEEAVDVTMTLSMDEDDDDCNDEMDIAAAVVMVGESSAAANAGDADTVTASSQDPKSTNDEEQGNNDNTNKKEIFPTETNCPYDSDVTTAATMPCGNAEITTPQEEEKEYTQATITSVVDVDDLEGGGMMDRPSLAELSSQPQTIVAAEPNNSSTGKDRGGKRVSFSEECKAASNNSSNSKNNNKAVGGSTSTNQTKSTVTTTTTDEENPSSKALQFDLGDIQEDEEEVKRRKRRQHQKIILAFVALVLVVGVGFLMAALFAFKGQQQQHSNNKTNISMSPTRIATSPPTFTMENYLWDLLRNYIGPAVSANSNAPQAKAFAWLINDPFLLEGFYTGNFPDWRIQQRFALASLYYSTTGVQWHNSTNWLSYDHHECDWYATPPRTCLVSKTSEKCDDDHQDDITTTTTSPCLASDSRNPELRQYTSLRLDGNNLQGQLPEELYWLTALQQIQLLNNQLIGTISTLIGKLRHLQRLDVSSNNLWGSIPSELFPPPKNHSVALQDLALFNNFLVGIIPTSIGNARKLINLLLEENGSLYGSIPSEMGLLSNHLRVVHINNCDLGDVIPSELGLLSHLETLHLSFNSLSSLPSELGQLKKLSDLHLDSNSLESSIPSELGLSVALEHLKLGRSKLTGPIPSGAYYLFFAIAVLRLHVSPLL